MLQLLEVWKCSFPHCQEPEADVSERRLCKEQLLPSNITDQTGVAAILLIPARHQPVGLAAVSVVPLVNWNLNYKAGEFTPFTPQLAFWNRVQLPICWKLSFFFFLLLHISLIEGLFWALGGNLSHIVSHTLQADFHTLISYEVWLNSSQSSASQLSLPPRWPDLNFCSSSRCEAPSRSLPPPQVMFYHCQYYCCFLFYFGHLPLVASQTLFLSGFPPVWLSALTNALHLCLIFFPRPVYPVCVCAKYLLLCVNSRGFFCLCCAW